MKKRLTTLLLAAAFFLSIGFAPTGEAVAIKKGVGPGKVYRVSAHQLNLRKSPSYKGKVLQVLNKNAQLTYISTPQKGWCKVRTSKGKVGYVDKKFIRFIKVVESLGPGKIYKVKTDYLRLRKKPNNKGEVITRMRKGTEVTYVSAKTRGWFKVRLKNGQTGYTASEHLKYSRTISAKKTAAVKPPASPFLTETLRPVPTPTPFNASAAPKAKATPKPTPKKAKSTPKPTKTPVNIVSITSKKYSYSDMKSDIRALQSRYPGQLHVVSIGKTMWGDDIPAIRIGSAKNGRSVLIDGTLHAREYMSTLLIMYQLEYYLARPSATHGGQTIRDTLKQCSIWFVPMMNPDGVYLSQNGVSKMSSSSRRQQLLKLNKGSSNFTRWKANGRGVDLNRNFSAGWYKDPKHKTAGSEGYGGSAPMSESETKALAAFVKSQKPRAAINYHTQGSYMYWHYGQTGSQKARDKKLADRISSMTGYWKQGEMKAGAKSGGFMDYFITEYRRPSMTLELGRTKAGQAPQPISEFPDIWKRNKFVPIYLAQWAAKN